MNGLISMIRRWWGQRRPSSGEEGRETHTGTLPEERRELPVQEILHGSVTIRDNRITVTDPDAYGSFAVCSIPHDPRLRVVMDGTPVTGEVIVTRQQEILVFFDHEKRPRREVRTTVSEDLLEVSMKVVMETGIRYSLHDAGPARKVTVRIKEDILEPPGYTVEELLRVIRDHGYQGDIDHAALEELSRTRVTLEKVVLRGTPPVAGKPAVYRPVPLPREYDPLLKRMRVASVTLGATIAHLEEEQPGISGKDVWGREIPVITVSRLPRLGEGVLQLQDRLVAARSGRLVFEDGYIDVKAELVISDDLTPKDGRIVFDGDVIIYGSVLDGSHIRASGVVKVCGGIMGATVIAEKGIIVTQNVVKSLLLAGQTQMIYAKLREVLHELLQRLENFRVDYHLLYENAVQRGTAKEVLPRLAPLLLEKRYAQLANQLMYILALNKQQLLEADSFYQTLAEQIQTRWYGIHRTQITMRDIEILARRIRDYRMHLETIASEKPAVIRAGSITSSIVKATGNVAIDGTGAYSSNIESQGSIFVRGLVRGGFLTAERSVRIHELGTPFGTESSVRVKQPGGVISIDIRHPNTLLEINGNRKRNGETEYHVRFRGNEYVAESAYLGRFA
jgi:septum formation inhibitor MinC